MASSPRTLRIPETANARILGEPFPVQVNRCRTSGRVNFGAPARTKPGKTGPNRDRDSKYAVISTSKGQESALRCKACNAKGGHPLECGHLCCSVLPADPSVYNERNGSACLSASDCPAEQHLEELPKGRSIRFSIEKCIVFGCH